MGVLLNYDDDWEIKCVRFVVDMVKIERVVGNRGNLIFSSCWFLFPFFSFFVFEENSRESVYDYFWNRYLEIGQDLCVSMWIGELLTRIIIQSCNYTVERTNQLLLIRGILTRNVWLLLSVNTENFEVILFSNQILFEPIQRRYLIIFWQSELFFIIFIFSLFSFCFTLTNDSSIICNFDRGIISKEWKNTI